MLCVQARGGGDEADDASLLEQQEEAPVQQVDVEAAVEAAMAAVVAPAAGSVTDGDVLGMLLEMEAVSKAAIVQALALHMAASNSSSSEEGGRGGGDAQLPGR